MQTKRKNQNESSPYLASLVSYCPLCNSSFSPSRAAVISEGNDSQLLHVTCKQCASSIVLLLLVGEVGVSSVGLITDLTEHDVTRFKNGATVSSDDLLDLHQSLWSDGPAIC